MELTIKAAAMVVAIEAVLLEKVSMSTQKWVPIYQYNPFIFKTSKVKKPILAGTMAEAV